MTSLYEKKINDMLDKMFGNYDLELKNIMRLTLLKNKIPDEKIEYTNQVLENNIEYAKCIDEELTNTLDEKGNIVPATPVFNFLKVIDNQEFSGKIRHGSPVELENKEVAVKELIYDA